MTSTSTASNVMLRMQVSMLMRISYDEYAPYTYGKDKED